MSWVLVMAIRRGNVLAQDSTSPVYIDGDSALLCWIVKETRYICLTVFHAALFSGRNLIEKA